MKNIRTLLLAILGILFLGTACERQSTTSEATDDQAPLRVTFHVDLSAIDVPDTAEVGIRGSVSPLSWEESIEMEDPEGDGIYSVTIPFPDAGPGDEVLYKYIIGEDGWELNQYGELGNRFYNLKNDKQIVKAVWDEIEEFSSQGLLERLEWNIYYDLIFYIGSGKKSGESIQELVSREVAFWNEGEDWDPSLQEWANNRRIRMAASINGEFETVEETTDKITIRMNDWWDHYFSNTQTDGQFKGVTEEDIWTYFKLWEEKIAELNDWTMTAERGDNSMTITMEVQ